MPKIAVVVPAEQTLPVLDGLLTLYSVKAETLYQRTERYLDDEIPLTAVLSERAKLTALNTAIEQIGWVRIQRDTAATLDADHEIAAAAVHSVLVTAAERLVEACDEHVLPDGDLSPIANALAETVDALRLLESVDVAAREASAR